jgi:hypothetical protein
MRLVLLSASILVPLVAISTPAAQAEVVTIDGTIKSVDAQKRTITVESGSKTLTLDVSSKAKINVEGKDGGLDTLKPGQKVKLSYHKELEIVLKIEVAPAVPPDQTEPQVILRSAEIAIDENGGCTLTVDSRKNASTEADEKGDESQAGTDDKPEIVRLRNGNRRIVHDFSRLRSVEVLIPQNFPSDLKARMRGQLLIDKDAGVCRLMPIRAEGRVAFDLSYPMSSQLHLPIKIKVQFARFDQGRFNVVIRLAGTTFCVALDQRYGNGVEGIVRVDWRDKRGQENQPVHLERPEGWKSLLRYTQETEKATVHQFRIPPAAFRKLESQKQVSLFLGILGDQPIQIRRLEVTTTAFKGS